MELLIDHLVVTLFKENVIMKEIVGIGIHQYAHSLHVQDIARHFNTEDDHTVHTRIATLTENNDRTPHLPTDHVHPQNHRNDIPIATLPSRQAIALVHPENATKVLVDDHTIEVSFIDTIGLPNTLHPLGNDIVAYPKPTRPTLAGHHQIANVITKSNHPETLRTVLDDH